jgi:hypothetical protein
MKKKEEKKKGDSYQAKKWEKNKRKVKKAKQLELFVPDTEEYYIFEDIYKIFV